MVFCDLGLRQLVKIYYVLLNLSKYNFIVESFRKVILAVHCHCHIYLGMVNFPH